MAVSEFELIERYFVRNSRRNSTTRFGIGDDCAALSVPAGHQLLVTADTMVENVHFFPDADPEALGHKIVAVNLSDLASMGAKPIAITLALTIPEVNESWLNAFSQGIFRLANRYSVDLIGGDTTSGPLTMTVQAMGLVPDEQVLMRSAAEPGDSLFVTGELGEAGLGLKILQGYEQADDTAPALKRFHRPEPRIAAGLFLRQLANACIDVSDGLAADLKHILNASNVGASISWDQLPLSSAVHDYIEATGDWEMPLTAGDDYELCFTLSPDKVPELEDQADKLECNIRQIGVIDNEPGLRLNKSGKIQVLESGGFEHFR